MIKLNKRFFEKRKIDHYISTNDTEVKILFSSENPALLGQKVHATAIEMSPRALRLEVPFALEIGSVLDIALRIRGMSRDYHLTGNVRWRIPSLTGQYHIGLVLRERSDIKSDFKAWKSHFMQNFDHAKAS